MTKFNKGLVSICIPYYAGMKNADFYMKRCLDSIWKQTYQNFEIIVEEGGSSAENTNKAIKMAGGEFIKILHMDDFFYGEDSLEKMVKSLGDSEWLICACLHEQNGSIDRLHVPTVHKHLFDGSNTVGAPSVLLMRNTENPPLFDESLVWLFDCEYYHRLYSQYGLPKIVTEPLIVIGLHDGQATHTITDKRKNDEVLAMKIKYTQKNV